MDKNYQPSIAGFTRVGNSKDPFVQITGEVKQVMNGMCKLDEVPFYNDHVTVTAVAFPYESEVYTETFDYTSNIGAYNFFCDYVNGILYWNSNANGKKFFFSYTGRGATCISVERVFTKINGGNITETLGDIVLDMDNIKTAYDNATKANLSVEVSNARTSSINSKTFATLGDRLENSEQNTLTLNIKSFGAIGDGINDDTVAFQNAINYAQNKGQILYCENGIYVIKNRLYITKPITIQGASTEGCIFKFEGDDAVIETPYDNINYIESHGVFCIQSHNVTFMNFTLLGGLNKATASNWNGIIFHCPKTHLVEGVLKNYYASSERCVFQHITIKCFKNAIFIYGGWSRYFLGLSAIDCTVAGVNYTPLEIETVGNWSASGDAIQSSQFIGNTIGYKADRNFETTLQNCVFEYNTNAIYTYGCKDAFFINCWNEANEGNILINGSAKFSGGYNIIPSTVTHIDITGKGVVEFETDTDRIIKQNNNIVFYQTGGIITTGVSLGSKRLNIVPNASFGTIATPNFDQWTVEAGVLTSIDTVNILEENFYSAVINCDSTQGWGFDPLYGIMTAEIPINPSEDYIVSIQTRTENMTEINKGAFLAIQVIKNGTVLTWTPDQNITPISNNSWESFSFNFNAISLGYGDATHIKIKFFIKQYGKVWFTTPFFGDSSVTNNDISLKLTETSGIFEVVNHLGNVINTVVDKTYVDSEIARVISMIP